MTTNIPADLNEVHEFVQRHEPAGRIWALGSADGYANWLFLRRIALDRNPSYFVARGYAAELVARDRAGSSTGEGDIGREAALLQLKIKAVNHARCAVADLVSTVKRQRGALHIWESICGLATSHVAAARAQEMNSQDMAILGPLLEMVVHYARPLVDGDPVYRPTSDCDSDVDKATFEALIRLDESMREEPAWNATKEYQRPELQALVGLADDADVASVMRAGFEYDQYRKNMLRAA